ncbi:Xaa-Pro aminopeptidase [Thalassotalea atypica]|uniref:Xaa-Pro aminopeptidase n=1 Tax=Thalassotalea atypica TaxID=2054316 RepID=UPI00257299E3|nr:Xaa-Pro aminopeptidase [Thalassotalea atypica]
MIKHTLLPASEFVSRRDKFAAQMEPNSVAFISANKEVTRSNDTEYSFCQDKNFYYLTGFNEPDALLLLIKIAGAQAEYQSILFCRDKDPMQEVWHGRRVGPELAKEAYVFDQTFTLDKMDEQVTSLINGVENVYHCFTDVDLNKQVDLWIKQVASQLKMGKRSPTVKFDCSDIIHELRLIKSEAELEIMRQVNVISGNAHQRAMKYSRAGRFEYQIEAEILHEFASNGARFAAYNSIVAGGDNANILHYTDNQEELEADQLLLIDAGGEYAGYAADITRTFPINGKFTEEQKAVYELVLKSQIVAIEAIKPGMTFARLNELVGEVLTQGLFDLGILTGNIDELLKANACKKFFIHGLGHWLGLDVHDVGDYHINEKRQQLREFKPGMVMTIEPGIYIPKGCDVEPKWQGIGVRIEDNIAVTESGYENLTVNSPKTIADIEALMQS